MSYAAKATEGVTAVQVWTLVVASLAVTASVYAAVLLRKTGKGTVEQATRSADAALEASRAAADSALTASKALSEQLRLQANAVVEEGHLDELLDQRAELRGKIATCWHAYHELGALQAVTDTDDWRTDVGTLSPSSLRLPEQQLPLKTLHHLPMGAVGPIMVTRAVGSRFRAADRADERTLMRMLCEISNAAREARVEIDKSLEGALGVEARLTSDIRTARNTITSIRRGEVPKE